MDFVTQATLDSGIKPPPDALGQDELAKKALKIAAELPLGSLMAVHGSWGRGKTDFLYRMAYLTKSQEYSTNGIAPQAIWINPWQYGSTDLLTPIVMGLLEKVEKSKRKSNAESLKKAASAVISAGASFGLKTVASFVPAGSLLYDAAAAPAEKLIEKLFDAWEAETDKEEVNIDHVAEMASKFRFMVDIVLKNMAGNLSCADSDRILIFIDDLDRCLPERQIAFLEALRFVGSANARATIVVALDPILINDSLEIYYKSRVFSPEKYLQKIFAHRTFLPEIDPLKTESIIGCLLANSSDKICMACSYFLRLRLPNNIKNDFIRSMEITGSHALSVSDLKTPRAIYKMMPYWETLLKSGEWIPQNHLDLLVAWWWLGLVLNWPEVRKLIQGVEDRFFDKNFQNLLSSLMKPDAASNSFKAIRAAEIRNREQLIDYFNEVNVTVRDRRDIYLVHGEFNIARATGAFLKIDNILIKNGL